MFPPQELSFGAFLERGPPCNASFTESYIILAFISFWVQLLKHFETNPLLVVILENADSKLFLSCFPGDVVNQFTGILPQRRCFGMHEEVSLDFTFYLLDRPLRRRHQAVVRGSLLFYLSRERRVLRIVEAPCEGIMRFACALQVPLIEGRRVSNLHEGNFIVAFYFFFLFNHHKLIFIGVQREFMCKDNESGLEDLLVEDLLFE